MRFYQIEECSEEQQDHKIESYQDRTRTKRKAYGVLSSWDGIKEEQCSGCSGAITFRRVEPIHLKVYGKNILDIIWTDSASGITVTNNLYKIFREYHITGTKYSEVIVDEYVPVPNKPRPPEELPEKLMHIDVVGKGGSISEKSICFDDDGKRIKLNKYCRSCNRNISLDDEFPDFENSKMYFSLSSWDGSDCFWVDCIGEVYSEKVIQMFEENNVQNWEAVPVEYVE